MRSNEPLLEVKNLKTQFETDRGTVNAVNGVNFKIEKGETFGLVGESGAGKSVTSLSIMDLVDSPGHIANGEIYYKGKDLLSLSEEEIRDYRGNEIAMIFQDPMTSLNPAFTVGEQISDVIIEHMNINRSDARNKAVELLSDVGIPDASERIDDYPHQFSGGMRQRALIAMSLSCNPDLLIADEPTTALDVTIQAQIIDLLKDLQEDYNMSILLITHDMGVISEICDTVAVMYAGKIVEKGSLEDLFKSPKHPYTIGLIKSIPRIGDNRQRLETIEGTMPDLIDTPSGCSFRDRCPHAIDECARTEPSLEPTSNSRNHTAACIRTGEINYEDIVEIRQNPSGNSQRVPERDSEKHIVNVENLKKYFEPESQSLREKLFDRKYVHAVDDISMTINEGECLGLVGESGCGKTTLGRTLIRLYEPDDGTVLYAGENITKKDKKQMKDIRSDLQIIFQDPFSSLNPRKTIKNIIGRPIEIHGNIGGKKEKRERVVELLDRVGLKESHLDRYPHEFSGGQKQRIGIARALAVKPDFIVCDEPVSALDVSVQSQILNLMSELQDELGITYLFIAHDLNVVQHISDRIAVMYLGEIIEMGTVQDIFEPPHHPYTEMLLSAIPQPNIDESIQSRIIPEGSVPSPIDPPSGCRFHTRCPYAMEECKQQQPSDINIEDGHVINCHLYDEYIMGEKDQEMQENPDNPRGTLENQRLHSGEE